MVDEHSVFALGERVRILDLDKPGHVRVPIYVRGKTGKIDQVCGAFENPEERAYGRAGGARIPLYRVRLDQSDLWEHYSGSHTDTVVIEVYSHWLESA